MKIHSILFIMCTLFFSGCKEKEIEMADDSDTEVLETIDSAPIENFPTVNAEITGFKKNPEFRKDGATFYVALKIKNNTPNKINYFKLTSNIKAVYDDDTVQYFPNNFYSEDDTENEILERGITTKMLKDQIWNPGEIKEFDVVVFGYEQPDFGTSHKENIDVKLFSRTPRNLTYVYKYVARGVDGEYTDTYRVDILNYWEKYQSELGLR